MKSRLGIIQRIAVVVVLVNLRCGIRDLFRRGTRLRDRSRSELLASNWSHEQLRMK